MKPLLPLQRSAWRLPNLALRHPKACWKRLASCRSSCCCRQGSRFVSRLWQALPWATEKLISGLHLVASGCSTPADTQWLALWRVVLQAAALVTVPEVEQEQSVAAFEARWSAYMQEAIKLNLVLGAHAAHRKPIHHRQVA